MIRTIAKKICDREGITLTYGTELTIAKEHIVTESCAVVGLNMFGGTKREVLIHDNTEGKDIIVFHEIGHILHPSGNNEYHKLQAELAANEWAISHYVGAYDMDDVISLLRKNIMTYIGAGYTYASTAFKPVADKLNITEYVDWINDEKD